jgi:tyrosyl-tRNA synthetase
VRKIRAASSALFGGGALEELDVATLSAALREAGSTQVRRADAFPTVVDLLVATGLSKSKGDARRTLAEGGAYLNNRRVTEPDAVPVAEDLLGGSWLVLRRGKKNLAGVEVVD